jgi:hypothetical protein
VGPDQGDGLAAGLRHLVARDGDVLGFVLDAGGNVRGRGDAAGLDAGALHHVGDLVALDQDVLGAALDGDPGVPLDVLDYVAADIRVADGDEVDAFLGESVPHDVVLEDDAVGLADLDAVDLGAEDLVVLDQDVLVGFGIIACGLVAPWMADRDGELNPVA